MADLEESKRSPKNAEEAALSASEDEMSSAGYLRGARTLLAKGHKREAYELLQPAVVKYPEDPFILSYFGYLAALLEGKYRNGIEHCKQAIAVFEKMVLHSEESVEERLKAVLYLNLGRAYFAGGKKKDAFETLQKGLRFDKQNKDLMAEIERMGIRKYVPLSFLDRTNPINELVGRLLRRTSKNP